MFRVAELLANLTTRSGHVPGVQAHDPRERDHHMGEKHCFVQQRFERCAPTNQNLLTGIRESTQYRRQRLRKGKEEPAPRVADTGEWNRPLITPAFNADPSDKSSDDCNSSHSSRSRGSGSRSSNRDRGPSPSNGLSNDSDCDRDSDEDTETDVLALPVLQASCVKCQFVWADLISMGCGQGPEVPSTRALPEWRLSFCPRRRPRPSDSR